MKKTFFIIIFSFFQLLGFAQWNTDRILTIGQNALYFEDYVLSIQYFNQVIKIRPYLAEPYMYRAIAKIQLGDDKGAELDATEAIDRNPFLPQAYYVRGFAFRRMGKYEKAIEDFSKAIEFSPGNYNLLLNRIDAYVRLEKYKEAMADLDNYMRLNPKSGEMYYEKGVIQLSMKDTAAAETSFNKLVELDSTNSMSWSARGLLRLQKNKLDEAYSDYSKAILLKSNFSGDYINRGIINVENKNYREALSDYDNAIKLDKENGLAYFNRALLRANLGDNNNALSDLEMVLRLDTTNTEAVYRKALLENTLGKYKNAIKDFNKILTNHPYFIPAMWGISEANEKMGNTKEAFRYKQMAYDIEKNKDSIKKKQKEDKIASDKNIIDKKGHKGNASKKTEMFNRFITQNIDDDESESKYKDKLRGTVQNKYADVVNERNFGLTYYAKNDEIRRTNLYSSIVEDYNKKHLLKGDLKITNNEIALTPTLINEHFDDINKISGRIAGDENNANLYFYRGLEFALVQDFNSSLDDLNKTLMLRPDFTIAYFCRANIRYKLVEYQKSTYDNPNELNAKGEKNRSIYDDNQYKFDVEMIMRDYDKVIQLQPNFSFAYYNKANILCTQKDFKTAIANYTKAIGCDADFAEAYFNRGLTYLFIGEDNKGIADLSKAGELGIYQSYNLIQRFNK
ncbi:MAG: tetratricopeptide repeat protein [Paludibacter sp.]|nr:tetratricopeptide repeat protein [Paludibacter sp.]